MNIRFLVLALTLLLVAMPIRAEQWELVRGETDSNLLYFVNTSSIQRGGNSSTFWIRNNYSDRGSRGELSAMNQISINCLRKEWTLRHSKFFDDINGQGKEVLSRDLPSDWRPISPKTTMFATLNLVCR